MLTPVILYLLLCVICGLMARQTKLGFWWGALAAAVLTPWIFLVVIIVVKFLTQGGDDGKEAEASSRASESAGG